MARRGAASRWLRLFWILLLPSPEPVQAAEGLFQALTGKSLTDLPGLSAIGVSAGGWLSAGITYNGNNPANGSNLPVTFNDQSDVPQLNQLYLFAERVVNKESKKWDLGGRVDFLYGSDSRFTEATGHWDQHLITEGTSRYYRIAIPQAYLEIATPFVRGATLKAGHFYTILGQEVVPSPNNFFYSHSYSMQYGEPFTHTGLLGTYPVNMNLTVNLGAVLGPYESNDNFSNHGENWNFLGGATWMSDEGGTSLAASLTSGPASINGTDANRTVATVVLNYDLTEKLHLIGQYDYGFQDDYQAGQRAEWYGLLNYATYNVTESVWGGVRMEWFRDQNGFRVLGVPASYYEVTTGLNWKPQNWLLLRAETRYDWADAEEQLFDSGTRNSQFTLGANFVVTF